MTAGRGTRGAAAATGLGVLDAPTEGDHRRMRTARRVARARYREIEAARAEAVLEAFRAEIGAVVRSASPLLGPMLVAEGLTVDEAAMLIRPQIGWPRHPRLSGRRGVLPANIHLLRHYVAGLRPKLISSHPLNGHEFKRGDGGFLLMQAVDHSLDLNARIGRVLIETRFGELRVEFMDVLPQAIVTGCVGRLIEEIVDHAAWRGRGWRIVGTRDADPPFSGQTLIVATGSLTYQMPWARLP